jgi:hypothetical protein
MPEIQPLTETKNTPTGSMVLAKHNTMTTCTEVKKTTNMLRLSMDSTKFSW